MRLFVYLSDILGRRVVDAQKRLIGKVYDLSMNPQEEVFPRAEAIIVKNKGQYANIAIGSIKEIEQDVVIDTDAENVSYEKKISCDFSLRKHIYDQQVVDTNDRKVVRVNDVHLLRVDHNLYLAHVDVGLRGLVRRLGWNKFIDGVIKVVAPNSTYLTEEELISWRNTHVLTTGRGKNVLRSTVAREKLAKIPAAELADIMEDLDIYEKLSLFKTFNVEMQRKIFTDMTPQEKEELVDQLSDKEAGNLLEHIPADEATDLLHNLPKEKTLQLMRFMHSETSKQLRKLLGFAQDTAGGLMTTEFLCLNEDANVEDALELIKNNVEYPGNIFFVYLVDVNTRLIGTTSLRRFINEDPKKALLETCYPNKIFVRIEDGMEEVALLLEKYKFSSIPVLNENDVLQGVITSDDVMEELIALTWKKYKDQI